MMKTYGGISTLDRREVKMKCYVAKGPWWVSNQCLYSTEMTLRNKYRNSIMMTYQYPRLDIVLLTGWGKSSTYQKHYPDLHSDTSSVWNFCAPPLDKGIASPYTYRPGPTNFWFDHSTICNKLCIVGESRNA